MKITQSFSPDGDFRERRERTVTRGEGGHDDGDEDYV